MNTNDRLVGSLARKSVEQFREARLVGIARRAFAIWLDPFGMLFPQVVVNLLPELGEGVDLVRHGNWLGERFKRAAARRGSSRQRHAPAHGARDAGPTGLLWSAGVAGARPAVRFA